MLLNEKVLSLLRSLEIHIWDAEDLFDILDVDDSGSMDIKEFFEGFSRVKGTAHGKHLLKLHYDVLRENAAFRETLEEMDSGLKARLGKTSKKALDKLVGLEEVLRTELAPHIPPWKPGASDGSSQKTESLAYDEAALTAPGKPTLYPPSSALSGGVDRTLSVSSVMYAENGNSMAANFAMPTVDAEEASEVLRNLTDLANTWQQIESGFDLALKAKSKESVATQ
jgi:hypothetical protein